MKLYSEDYIDRIMDAIVMECDDETIDRIKARFEEMDMSDS